MNSTYIAAGLLLSALPLAWVWVFLHAREKRAERKTFEHWSVDWKKRWEKENRYPFDFFIQNIQYQIKRVNRIKGFITFFCVVLILGVSGLIWSNVYYTSFLSSEQLISFLWIVLLALFSLLFPCSAYFQTDKDLLKEMMFKINEILYREKYDLAFKKRLEREQGVLTSLGIERTYNPDGKASANIFGDEGVPAAGEGLEGFAGGQEQGEPAEAAGARQYQFPSLEGERAPDESSLLEKIKGMGPDSAATAIKTFLSQNQT